MDRMELDARCTFDGKDRCLLSKDEDCQSSEFCTKLQRCAYDKATKKCLPGNDAQCKSQSDCKAGAACTYDAKAKSKCVPSEADCKESVLCKNLGLCALNKVKMTCVPGSEEDCKLTVDCKAGKICAWDDIDQKFNQVWQKAGSEAKKIAELEHLQFLIHALHRAAGNTHSFCAWYNLNRR